jgi:hypothetical protein
MTRGGSERENWMMNREMSVDPSLVSYIYANDELGNQHSVNEQR